MLFSSEGVLLSSKSFFQDSTKNIPLCKEYAITLQNGCHYKIALIIFFIACTIHQWMFVEYSDIKNKYCVIFLFASLALILSVSLSYTVVKESLLLVVPLTLQMTTSYIFGSESTLSLPWHTLGDLMIMEVIMGQRVRYFLSIVVNMDNNKEMDHVILFRNSQPPFKCLELLYRELQSILDRSR